MSTICHMYATDSILTFSFPMGSWLGARFRLSILMPVMLMAVAWRLDVVHHPGNVVWAGLAGMIILYSILLHELAHVLAARMTGGDAEDIIVWPLGGLVAARPGPGIGAALFVTFAGPVVNLLVALMCIPALHGAGQLIPLLNPFAGFSVDPNAAWTLTSLRMAFAVNWCLTFVNLIPLIPLDGGHGLRWFLSLRFTDPETRDVMLRIGLVTGLLGMGLGFVCDVSGLVALSAFILVLHIHEAVRSFQSKASASDDSFRGYDFSEGYTSLDRSAPDWSDEGDDAEEESNESAEDFSRTGLLERWRSRREQERQRREAAETLRDESQLDEILEKLHTQGRDALNSAELSVLDRVSRRLRQRNENASA